jgi:hypothetical protein
MVSLFLQVTAQFRAIIELTAQEDYQASVFAIDRLVFPIENANTDPPKAKSLSGI